MRIIPRNARRWRAGFGRWPKTLLPKFNLFSKFIVAKRRGIEPIRSVIQRHGNSPRRASCAPWLQRPAKGHLPPQQYPRRDRDAPITAREGRTMGSLRNAPQSKYRLPGRRTAVAGIGDPGSQRPHRDNRAARSRATTPPFREQSSHVVAARRGL